MGSGCIHTVLFNIKTLRVKRRTLIWYNPGMISLVLLPVFCLCSLNRAGYFEKQNIIPVFCITKEFYDPSRNGNITFIRPPDRRNLEILLDGNEGDVKNRLDYAQRYVGQIALEHDTLKGILFRFAEGAKYWMFVRALDICKSARVQYFVTMDNSVQAYYETPEILDSFHLPFHFCEVPVDNGSEQQAEMQAREEEFQVFFRNFWPVALAFCLLVFCSGLRMN
jgi:hypothetical protein